MDPAAENPAWDVVGALAEALRSRDVPYEVEGKVVRLPGPAFTLTPRVEAVDAAPPMGTVTSLEVRHASFPTGLLEFQHATGDGVTQSLRAGFQQWVDIDLPVLADAVRNGERQRPSLLIRFPGGPERRVVLGPVAAVAPDVEPDGHRPGCPCCLFTSTMRAFDGHLRATGTVGIRLFAMRTPEGEAAADCRVNGQDFEPGAEALRSYVRTWRGAGFAFRKQYLVILDDRGDSARSAP